MKILSDTFQTGEHRYSTDHRFTYNDNPDYFINQRRLASFVGTIAIALPAGLYLIAKLELACHYHSISHYYYAWFLGSVFVISLAFIGTFLIAFRGTNKAESRLATFAGIATFGIALFPTGGVGCSDRNLIGRVFMSIRNDGPLSQSFVSPDISGIQPFDLFNWSSEIHYASAAILFAFLAWYSFMVFTRVESDGKGPAALSRQKKIRNRIYAFTGSVILICMAMLAAQFLDSFVRKDPLISSFPDHWTFWFEAIALIAFGWAWITKGRYWNWLLLENEEIKQLERAR